MSEEQQDALTLVNTFNPGEQIISAQLTSKDGILALTSHGRLLLSGAPGSWFEIPTPPDTGQEMHNA